MALIDQIHDYVALANRIGRARGLCVKYQYASGKGKFIFRFYRCGRYVGTTADPHQVVAKMEKYATCTNS